MSNELTPETAKAFFGSLYDEETAPDLNRFDSAAIRLAAKYQDRVMVGDKALGMLMLNHVISNPAVSDQTKTNLTAAVMGNIKASVLSKFLEEFPTQDLDSLVQSAKASGYDVTVLKIEDAKHLPRSHVGKPY